MSRSRRVEENVLRWVDRRIWEEIENARSDIARPSKMPGWQRETCLNLLLLFLLKLHAYSPSKYAQKVIATIPLLDLQTFAEDCVSTLLSAWLQREALAWCMPRDVLRSSRLLLLLQIPAPLTLPLLVGVLVACPRLCCSSCWRWGWHCLHEAVKPWL